MLPPHNTTDAILMCGVWRCACCRKRLGVMHGNVLEVRHGRLEMRGMLPALRRCERCRHWNALSPAPALCTGPVDIVENV